MTRVALVTGAASGIGARVAHDLAQAGYWLALVDRDEPGLRSVSATIGADSSQVATFTCDVSQDAALDSCLADVAQRCGRIDVLVNNAGYARDGHLLEMPQDDWDAVLDTHLRAAFRLIRALAPGMAEQRWGRIVNISSISSLGAADRANYVSAKAGLEGLTRAAAIDLAAHGITVNAVAPGFIETAMTAVSARRAGRTLREHLDHQLAGIPVGRIGQPADVSRAVLFFAAEDADYVTGQVLYISGGPHH